jgi:hypothetical protein
VIKVSLLLSIIFLVFSHSSFAAKVGVSSSELIKDINSGDVRLVVSDLNSIKASGLKNNTLHTVLELWNIDVKEHPGLNWSLVKEDVIRVELADVLLQAESNGLIKLNTEHLHEYVTSMLESKDPDVLNSAILALSGIADLNDINKIYKIAKQEQGESFRASVVSLTQMCNPAANRALELLRTKIKSKNNIEFLDKTMTKANDY